MNATAMTDATAATAGAATCLRSAIRAAYPRGSGGKRARDEIVGTCGSAGAPGGRRGRDRAVAPGEAQRDEHGVGHRAGRRGRRAGAGQAGDRRRARGGAGVLRGPRPGHARRREHARRLLRPAGGGVRRVGTAGPPGRRADPRLLPRRRPAAGVGVRHPDPRRGRRARAARRRRGAAAGDGDLAAAPLRRAGPGDAAVGRRRAGRRRGGARHRARRPRAARRRVRRGGRRAGRAVPRRAAGGGAGDEGAGALGVRHGLRHRPRPLAGAGGRMPGGPGRRGRPGGVGGAPCLPRSSAPRRAPRL